MEHACAGDGKGQGVAVAVSDILKGKKTTIDGRSTFYLLKAGGAFVIEEVKVSSSIRDRKTEERRSTP